MAQLRGIFILLIFLIQPRVSLAQVRASTAPKIKQTDLIEVIVKALHITFKEKPLGKKRVSFSFIPVSTTSSGGNKIFVSSINAAFILGPEDSTNVSSIYFLPYTDFSENIGYRFDITENGLLGAVVFANIQSLSEPTSNNFSYSNPAAGFGARIKFNKQSNTNLTLDAGFGKNSFGFYIGLGEFF